MDLGLSYVNVFVTDFAAAVDFYKTKLGLEVNVCDEKFGYASFKTRGAALAVARVDPSADNAKELVGRHTGVGLMVEDIKAAYEELRSKGVEFTMAPTKQPWGGVLALFKDCAGNIFYLDQVQER